MRTVGKLDRQNPARTKLLPSTSTTVVAVTNMVVVVVAVIAKDSFLATTISVKKTLRLVYVESERSL